MMSKSLCVLLMLLIGFAFACKKAEEPKPQQQTKQPAATTTKKAQAQKKNKNGKKDKAGRAAAGLSIYQDTKLVTTIAPAETLKLMTTPIKVAGKDFKGVLLSDLLKQHNLTGKNVILKGPHKSSTISWDEATKNPIYIYAFKRRLQLYSDSKAIDPSRIPVILVGINVANTDVAAEDQKDANKSAT